MVRQQNAVENEYKTRDCGNLSQSDYEWCGMMHNDKQLAEHVAAFALLAGCQEKTPVPVGTPQPGKVMILAPHPDDECIIGALPLRLQREAGMTVTVVPVTLGSKPERREARRQELQAACEVLGFSIAEVTKQPFAEVRPETRQAQPIVWQGMTAKLAGLIAQEQPNILFLPHRYDGHGTHIGVHGLAMDALAKQPTNFTTRLIFTEFWHPQRDPNLMVESSPTDLLQLLTALSRHVGEVARNPYHLRLPAWMIDNVRRGTELIGGFGAAEATMGFATLYEQAAWRNGQCLPLVDTTLRLLPAHHSAAAVISSGS